MDPIQPDIWALLMMGVCFGEASFHKTKVPGIKAVVTSTFHLAKKQ